MKNRICIQSFALPFHLEKSRSHETLVEKPLSPYVSFKFLSWNGIQIPSFKDPYEPLLFFQYPPPVRLLGDTKYRLIWLPMWDHIRNYPDSFWKRLSNNIKIVAFSDAVYQKAKKYNICVLRLKYYSSSDELPPVIWKHGKILFYWNRIGLIGKDDLEKICSVFKISILYFQNQLDPGLLKSLNYNVPDHIGSTKVICIPKYLDRSDYNKILTKSNMYIAPRIYEGVGLSFIESLSRGCFVMGSDTPTLNEYITHRENGYLFSYGRENIFRSFKQAVRIRLPVFSDKFQYKLKLRMNPLELANIDLEKIGNNAIKKSREGRKKWESKIEEYYKFITEW